MQADCDYLFKIVIIGDSGVGKSSMLGRFSDDKFADMYITTIGVDFRIRSINIEDKVAKLQMWDTAGQERFGSIVRSYYHGAHGFILVFDITDRESFENLRKWHGEMTLYGSAVSQSVLIGNKVDLEAGRKVSYHEAKAFADALGFPYLETSAKSSVNIEQTFYSLATCLKEAVDAGVLRDLEKKHILLNNDDTNSRPVQGKSTINCC